jgi:gliding motility-associated-like protein
MLQRPFSFILSKRSLSTIRPWMMLLLLFLLKAKDGYSQNFALGVNPTSGSCGNSNGAITVTVNPTGPGPVFPPYTYYIQTLLGTVVSNNTGVFQGLSAGVYNITVIDMSNQTATASTTVYVAPGPSISANSSASLCEVNDGTIQVSYLGGGQAPIAYALGPGAYGSSLLFSNVAAGPYKVYAQDFNHCIDSFSGVVPLSIDLRLTMPNDTTICQGTQALLQPSTNATIFAWTPATGLSNTAIGDPVAAPTTTTTYTLTATLGVCTSSPETVTVNVLPAPVAAAVSPVGTCYGKSVELQGSGGVSYQWSPSTYLSNPAQQDPIMVDPHASETYQLTVVGANGCTSLKPATVVVNVVPPLKVFAGDDTSVVVGQSVPMNAIDVDGVGFTQYAWTPTTGLSNPNIVDPTALVNASITYTVTATAPDGCQGVDSMTIKAFTSQADIFVPNAFTPNNDGHNDLLRAIPIGIAAFKYFTVYNRWGQQVFSTTNASLGWDGTLSGHTLLPGTFVWVAAGVDYTGRLVERKGVVLLIR